MKKHMAVELANKLAKVMRKDYTPETIQRITLEVHQEEIQRLESSLTYYESQNSGYESIMRQQETKISKLNRKLSIKERYNKALEKENKALGEKEFNLKVKLSEFNTTLKSRKKYFWKKDGIMVPIDSLENSHLKAIVKGDFNGAYDLVDERKYAAYVLSNRDNIDVDY